MTAEDKVKRVGGRTLREKIRAHPWECKINEWITPVNNNAEYNSHSYARFGEPNGRWFSAVVAWEHLRRRYGFQEESR
jgi:hypothetical protein